MALPPKKRSNQSSLPGLNSTMPILPKEELYDSDTSLKELNYDEIREVEVYETEDVSPKPTYQKPIPRNDYFTGHDEDPFIEEPDEDNDYRNYDEDKFIDKNEMKIVPIGGKKARAKDFDDRKNSITPLKAFRLMLFGTIVSLFVFGIKNTFFPSNVFTAEEISTIARDSVGDTGYPIERGQAFAENFIKAYLNLDNTDVNNKDLLSEFYGGTDTKSGARGNVSLGQYIENKQKPLTEPKTFEIINTTENSTMYKITTLVSDETGNSLSENISTSHWISFAVNVYYDEKTQKMSIPEGNPYIIPSYELDDFNSVPEAFHLGNGEDTSDEQERELFPTVAGFLKAYAISSEENHNDLVQYITEDATSDLYSGFNGTVKLASSDEQSIEYNSYNTDEENTWKLDITVTWKDTKSVNDDSGAIYTSRYVMTITKFGKKYLVTKFNPYIYIPK